MLLRCFAQQHGERFAAQERELGLRTGGCSGDTAVEAMVRLAFQQVGGSFERPSRETLTRVVNLLSERSLEWGGVPESILECHTTMMRQIAFVEDLPPHGQDTMDSVPN
ncbi:MAG: hypothetical protein RBS17_00375 [Coriobacteriia bacterium]|nr:hypothetical protein [Coriobacteriia bacterium]